jgi:hypothetical protein
LHRFNEKEQKEVEKRISFYKRLKKNLNVSVAE